MWPSFHFHGRGTLDQLKSKVPQSGQVFIFGVGERGSLDQVKPEVPTSLTIFISGGGSTLDTTFHKYLSGGTQGILGTKFSQPKLTPASQCMETKK